MKIRINYVSNSSSSSFIVQFNSLDDKIVDDITLYDFFDHIRKYNWGDENELYFLINKEDNDNYEKEKMIHFFYNKNEFTNIKNEILSKKDACFACFDLGYHDKIGKFIFNIMQEKNIIKILHKDA